MYTLFLFLLWARTEPRTLQSYPCTLQLTAIDVHFVVRATHEGLRITLTVTARTFVITVHTHIQTFSGTAVGIRHVVGAANGGHLGTAGTGLRTRTRSITCNGSRLARRLACVGVIISLGATDGCYNIRTVARRWAGTFSGTSNRRRLTLCETWVGVRDTVCTANRVVYFWTWTLFRTWTTPITCDVFIQARGGTRVDEGLVVSGTHWVTLNGAFTGSRTGAGSFTLDRCTAAVGLAFSSVSDVIRSTDKTGTWWTRAASGCS